MREKRLSKRVAILKQTIKELEELLKLKDQRIQELTQQSLEKILQPAIVTVPQFHTCVFDPYGYQVGDFAPRRCKICGQSEGYGLVVTCDSAGGGTIKVRP